MILIPYTLTSEICTLTSTSSLTSALYTLTSLSSLHSDF